MKISAESELMKNHKQATLAPSALTFEAVQSKEGDTVFFSLEGGDTDKMLYATREITNSTSASGWQKIALSSSLPCIPSPSSVKMFAITQNPTTMALDIALVATDTAQGVDYFFLSLGHPNDTNAWADAMVWTYYKFDGLPPAEAPPLEIVDIFVMNNLSSENFFVDILRSPTQSNFIDRYFIQPSSTSAIKWKSHTIGGDMQQGLVTSCLGRRQLPNQSRPDFVPCIYTLGDSGAGQELLYSPSYLLPGMGSAISSATLSLPPNTDAYTIASAALSNGTTNLFVATSDGLYVFPPDSQYMNAPCTKIVQQAAIGGTSLFGSGMSIVAATVESTVASNTTIWYLNQGMLFQIYCTAGQESDPTAWCNPFPFSIGVESFAFYLNYPLSYNVLFARTSDTALTKYIQDPNTTVWRQQTVILPSDNSQDLFEYNTFTSHISVTDDYSVALRGESVSINPDSPVSVSVNGLVTNFDSNSFVTDVTGCISIVQETQSLSAVCFTATLSDGTALRIDPLCKASDTLSGVTDSTALKNVNITTADGTSGPLIDPATVTDQDLDTAVGAMTQLMSKKKELGSSSSLQAAQSSEALLSSHLLNHLAAKMPKHVRDLVQRRDSSRRSHEPLLGGFGSWIKCAIGDLVHGAKALGDAVENYIIAPIVGEAEDVYHLCITIGEDVYHAALDTVSGVVSALEFVLHKIEVGIEKLVAWLGFLFSWGDILRTHTVMKKTLLLYFQKAVNGISSIEGDIQALFQKLGVDDLSNVQDPPSSIGAIQQSQSSNPPAGSKSPQANWAVQHTNNGISSAQGGESTGATNSDTDTSDFDVLLQKLGDSFTDDLIGNMGSICQDIKSKIFDEMHTLKPGEAVIRILQLIGQDILGDVEATILALLDVLKVGMDGILDFLDAPLDIPVLSALYNQITHTNLSFLDLMCLIGAIPATICFKLITNSAPFASGDIYSQITDSNTQTWEQLTQIISGDNLESVVALQRLPKGRRAKGLAGHGTQLQPYTLGSSPYTNLDIFQLVFNLAGAYGGLASVITTCAKRPYDVASKDAPFFIRLLDFLAYGLYCSPDYFSLVQDPGAGDAIFNDSMTMLSIVKKGFDNLTPGQIRAGTAYTQYSDKVSPWLEMGINIIWLGPAIWSFVLSCEADRDNAAAILFDVVELIQNLAFDLGGILTPFTSVKYWEDKGDGAAEETAAPFFENSIFCCLLCSGLSADLVVMEAITHGFG